MNQRKGASSGSWERETAQRLRVSTWRRELTGVGITGEGVLQRSSWLSLVIISGSERDESLSGKWCAGRVRPGIRESQLENAENSWRSSLKGGLSQRGPEVFRDALYAMFPASERCKNRGRTLVPYPDVFFSSV